MKKHLQLILITLLTINTTAQEISQMRVVGMCEYLPSELISKEIRDANGEVCAGLMVKTDLSGLSFKAYNGIIKVNTDPGQSLVFVQPSERVLEIYKSGYEPLKIILNDYGISLKSGTVWQIKVTGDKKTSDLIPISIVTNVSDAIIYIDDVNMGTSKSQQVSVGKHELRIEKEGYKTEIKTIEVSTSNILFELSLKEIDLVAVNIKSNPTEASIFINNTDKGFTNKGFFLYPGKYGLRITKAGYLDVNEEIQITENGKNDFTYNLVKNSGLLNLTITPKDAQIKINNELKTQSSLELLPGEYTLDISKAGYLSQAETIQLGIGQTVSKNYTLVKNSGMLNLTLSPSDAQIRINNEIKTRSSFELLPGEYTLDVSKAGYLSKNEVVKIELGKTETRTINLTKNSGELLLTISPSDAQVLVNKENFSGKNKIELAPGRYKIEISKDGYYEDSETLEIELGKNTAKSFLLKQKVGKLQFSVSPLDASVELQRNGKTIEKWQGLKILKDLQVGEYELTVKNSGYKTAKKTIKITENANVVEDINLEKGSDLNEMLFVQGGTFQMGSNDGGADEKPIHSVTLSDFYIGKYEVTQKEWKEIMGNNPSKFVGDNLPVEQVSWNDVQEFIEKLNAKTGKNYRLPTEAEWEYAARGGNQSKNFSYSGNHNVDEVAWHEDNSEYKTQKVGTKKPNELGIYDMSGNVWEWCNDWYDGKYYKNSPSNNPQGPSSGKSRVLRGGSWNNGSSDSRSADRNWDYPSTSLSSHGFRLVHN